jgi:hypothetical protein
VKVAVVEADVVAAEDVAAVVEDVEEAGAGTAVIVAAVATVAGSYLPR